jgi:eukaryotic-like serine/threonine-protein kinase
MSAVELTPGQQIGRYRITARIATGGMAEVFLVRTEGQAGFRKNLVLKRLLPHLGKDPQVVEMFLNEARINALLDHANIVHVFDLGQEGNANYMVMEFLDGRPLSEIQTTARDRGEEVPLPIGLKVLADACAGLAYAHEFAEQGKPLGIVHRDFSPDNIVVTYDGRVKVVDFGIAKAASIANQSEPGTLKGKYFYMSPEMVLGEPLDHRADIFAVGVILYELLTGQRPFLGESPREILGLIARCQPVTPTSIAPDVPPDLEALVLRCLARHPDHRPKSAKDIRAALEAHLIASNSMPSAADLGAYVERLFPAASDPERARLANLRKQEPSWPITSSAPSSSPSLGRRRQRLRLAAIIGGGALLVGAGGTAAVLALRSPPVNPKKLFTQGQEMLAKDPKAAVKLLRKAAAAAPGDTKVSMALGNALIASGDSGAAEDLANDLLKKTPNLWQAHDLLGDAYQAKRQGARAEEQFNLAAEMAPRDPEPRLHLGDLYVAMGDLPKAAESFEKARTLAPRDKTAVLRLGQVKARTGDWTGAIALLSQTTKAMPDDMEVRSELGYALYQANQDQKALAELLTVTKRAPSYAKAYYYLGFVYYHLGQNQKAIDSYLEAAAKDPGFADAHAALGDLYAQLGRSADAAREYRAALKIDPKHDGATEGLKHVQ